MASHLPVNHPLRPLYRVLVALVGAGIVVFGILGYTRTKGGALFAQEHLPWVLGLRTNLAFALLSIVSGAVLVVCAVVGRNVDYWINLVGGAAFMAIGMVMLSLLRTDVNFLGFSMTNCIVSFVIGTVVFAAGLYGRTGADQGSHRRV